MNTALIAWLAKTKEVVDVVFTCSALFAVPVIVVAPIGWLLDKPPAIRASFKSHSDEGASYQQVSGTTDIEAQEAKPLRTSYHMELIDSQGQALAYPQVDSKGTPELDNVIVPIPSSLQPGAYRLVAKIKYTINPLKVVEEEVQVSTIMVQ